KKIKSEAGILLGLTFLMNQETGSRK
ncbi:MAG: hypothetical protein ACI97R_001552, partial [Candidatus Azotimanducaceae bacterium]